MCVELALLGYCALVHIKGAHARMLLMMLFVASSTTLVMFFYMLVFMPTLLDFTRPRTHRSRHSRYR